VDHARQVEALVGWHKRVSSDAEFADPPPVGGLDALVDALTGATSDEAFRWLGLARWAVRVAEELVRVRACSVSGAPPATARVALSRLELALITAQRQLAEVAGSRAELAHSAGSTEGVDLLSSEEHRRRVSLLGLGDAP
jgi:hypothetical protein